MEPLENICYALSVLNDQVFAGKLSLLLTASGQARKSGGRFSGIDETALNALLQKGTAYYSDRYAWRLCGSRGHHSMVSGWPRS